MTRPAQRYALFGDVQGFCAIYAEALQALGVDTNVGVVPSDLTVIQVGDLIHKGPDSDAAIDMVDKLLRRSPENYVQLTGNHEGQYLGGPVFWPGTISDDHARTLAKWFVEGASRIAYPLHTIEHGPVLVSHGGMSHRRWTDLGEPDDVTGVARALNEEFWHDPASALRPGIMLRGEIGPPGVAWTEPVRELYEPWLVADRVPFAQVHGHASPYNWAMRGFYRGVPRALKKNLTIDTAARHTRLEIGGHAFLGIDTAFGPRDVAPIVPLILHEAPNPV